MAPVKSEPIACPRCGGGIAYPTFADQAGTNYQCHACGHGFTRPATAKQLEGEPVISSAIASPNTAGDPGAGSVTAKGEAFKRAHPSAHADAGPPAAPAKDEKEA